MLKKALGKKAVSRRETLASGHYDLPKCNRGEGNRAHGKGKESPDFLQKGMLPGQKGGVGWQRVAMASTLGKSFQAAKASGLFLPKKKERASAWTQEERVDAGASERTKKTRRGKRDSDPPKLKCIGRAQGGGGGENGPRSPTTNPPIKLEKGSCLSTDEESLPPKRKKTGPSLYHKKENFPSILPKKSF